MVEFRRHCGLAIQRLRRYASFLLRRLKLKAEDFLGEQVTDAVITVPASFDDIQRRAIRDAGKIAGLNVREIINEPTAAALAYGFGKRGSETVAVYNLGGGAFDLSIVRFNDGAVTLQFN